MTQCSINTPPHFSIIVVVLNRENVIQRCIDSVCSQIYPHKELIIIDGASTDSTVEILKNNSSNIDYWHSEKDNGIYNAMNKGVAKASGDWIIFLGADDFLIDDRVLQNVAERMIQCNCQSKLIYGKVAVISDDSRVVGYWGDHNHQIYGLPHQGTFHHKTLFETHGYFDESFRIAGDYELLLRELKCAKAAYLPDMVIAGFSNGGVSTDLDTAPLYWFEYARAQRMNGVSPYTREWFKCMSCSMLLWAAGKLLPENWAKLMKHKYSASRLQTACGFDFGNECEADVSILLHNPIRVTQPAPEIED